MRTTPDTLACAVGTMEMKSSVAGTVSARARSAMNTAEPLSTPDEVGLAARVVGGDLRAEPARPRRESASASSDDLADDASGPGAITRTG